MIGRWRRSATRFVFDGQRVALAGPFADEAKGEREARRLNRRLAPILRVLRFLGWA